MRRYCRAIELCDDYLRGYYGLKLTTKKLLESSPKQISKSSAVSTELSGGELPLPSTESIQKLHELATAKLSEIVRRITAEEPGWTAYDVAEVIAARELLDGDTQKITR